MDSYSRTFRIALVTAGILAARDTLSCGSASRDQAKSEEPINQDLLLDSPLVESASNARLRIGDDGFQHGVWRHVPGGGTWRDGWTCDLLFDQPTPIRLQVLKRSWSAFRPFRVDSLTPELRASGLGFAEFQLEAHPNRFSRPLKSMERHPFVLRIQQSV